MAAIEPNIALGVKPIQIENPMNQYAALSQLQANQNQNALAQYQLSAAQRADEAQNVQNQLYAKHYNAQTNQINEPAFLADLAAQNQGALIPKAQAQFAEQKYKENQGKKIVSEIGKLDFDLGTNIFTQAQNELKQIDPRSPDAPAQFLAWRERQFANPALADFFKNTGMTKEATDAQIKQAIRTPQGLADTILKSMTSADQFQKILNDREQLKVSQQNASTAAFNAATQAKSVANAANPELQNRIAEAKAVGEFFGKNKAAAAAALPSAIATATQTINLIDDMVGKPEIKDKNGKVIQQATKPRAGFNEYVGFTLLPGQRFIEGSDAASFELRQKQIEGKAFLEAFETLRGGGSITEKEGEKGAAAIMRMNKASSKEEYITAARELQDVLRSGIAIKSAKAGVPVNNNSNSVSPTTSNKSSGIAPPAGFTVDKP